MTKEKGTRSLPTVKVEKVYHLLHLPQFDYGCTMRGNQRTKRPGNDFGRPSNQLPGMLSRGWLQRALKRENLEDEDRGVALQLGMRRSINNLDC